MNILIKKYKVCVDNNSNSGRSLMTFKWFDQILTEVGSHE